MTGENEAAIKGIVRAVRWLTRAVYADTVRLSRRYGVTGSQGAVLRNIVEAGPLSSADLSRRLRVKPSSITGIIDRLESKGLVERIKKEGDRRVLLISLTDKGDSLARNLPDPLENKLVSRLADLDADHVRFLAEAMDELLSVVNTPDDDPMPGDTFMVPIDEIEKPDR